MPYYGGLTLGSEYRIHHGHLVLVKNEGTKQWTLHSKAIASVRKKVPDGGLDLRRGGEGGSVSEYTAPSRQVSRFIHGRSRYSGIVIASLIVLMIVYF